MAGQMVSFPSNGGTTDGYLALPFDGSGPGVIVIQEWWGLVPNIKNIADRFAGEGFVALAPDLYGGKSTTEPDEASKMMMSLNIGQAAKDMSGAYDYLKAHERTNGKVGSVGFCMGGRLSLYIAALKPVDACVIYYGPIGGDNAPDASKVTGPVLGHFAANDAWIPTDMVHALEKELRDAGAPVTMQIYPGTEHGFFNDTRPEVYNESAAEQSWDRTLSFFREHLGGGS